MSVVPATASSLCGGRGGNYHANVLIWLSLSLTSSLVRSFPFAFSASCSRMSLELTRKRTHSITIPLKRGIVCGAAHGTPPD